jgi:hypothetical protein
MNAVARPWRNRHHLEEANCERIRLARELREDRRSDAMRETPALFVSDGSRFSRFRAEVGARVGAVVFSERLTERASRSRGHCWRFRCDCGRDGRGYVGELTGAARRGYEPACETCLSQRRSAAKDAVRDIKREAFRRQFVDYRTLWTVAQTRRLMREVRDDLEAEHGPTAESLPSLRFGSIEIDPTHAETPRKPGRRPDEDHLGLPLEPWAHPAPLFGREGATDADRDKVFRAHDRARYSQDQRGRYMP